MKSPELKSTDIVTILPYVSRYYSVINLKQSHLEEVATFLKFNEDLVHEYNIQNKMKILNMMRYTRVYNDKLLDYFMFYADANFDLLNYEDLFNIVYVVTIAKRVNPFELIYRLRIKFNQVKDDLRPYTVLKTLAMYVKMKMNFMEQTFENIFTIGEQDYRPLDTAGIALLTRRLDARHLAERVLWMFRSGENIDRGRLDNFFNDYGGEINGAFYNEMKLVIAGQDREAWREPFVWQDIEALVNDERDNGLGLGEMRWNLGDVYERLRPAGRQPEGGINFTTADRPTLHINLRNVPPRTLAEGQRQTELRVFVEVWAIYETQEGRGRLVFGA